MDKISLQAATDCVYLAEKGVDIRRWEECQVFDIPQMMTALEFFAVTLFSVGIGSLVGVVLIWIYKRFTGNSNG